MKPGMVIFIVIVLVIGFVVSNRMTYADAINDQKFKCKMIEEGTWKRSDNFFEKYCNGKD